MLHITFPEPVKLFCGLIYTEEDIYQITKNALREKIGRIDFESETIPFDFTDYYREEMGKPLYRRFFTFRKLRDPAKVIKIKLTCLHIEKNLASGNKRTVNIDPGYVTAAKVVLLTTKNFHHRIYLGKGIFAEVTLYYQAKAWQEFPTTYPDYRTSRYKDIFVAIRQQYRQQLKNESRH